MAEKEKVSRRTYAKYATGAVVAVAAGAIGYYAGTTTVPPASPTPGAVTTVTTTATQTVTAPVEKPTPEFTFYLVTHAPPTAFFGIQKKGWDEACAAVNVKGVYTGSKVDGDVTEQLSLLEAAIAAEPDGIACVIGAPETMDEPLRRAIKMGIPVVDDNVIDPRPPDKRIPYLVYIGENSYESGHLQAEVFLKIFGKAPKRACFINHAPMVYCMVLRWEGFKDALTAAGCKTIDNFATVYDPVKTSEDVRAYLTAHPDCEYMGSGFIEVSCFAADVIKELGLEGKTLVSAIDITDHGLQYILDGKITNTIDQQPYLQGFYCALELWHYKKYKLIPRDIYTGPYSVTKENAAEIMELAAKGYR